MKAVNYFPNKLHLRSYNELDLNTPLLWNIEGRSEYASASGKSKLNVF